MNGFLQKMATAAGQVARKAVDVLKSTGAKVGAAILGVSVGIDTATAVDYTATSAEGLTLNVDGVTNALTNQVNSGTKVGLAIMVIVLGIGLAVRMIYKLKGR